MASRIDTLLANYRRQVALPWQPRLAGPQKVWFAVYPKEEERRLRYRVEEFKLATTDHGKGWRQLDLTGSFGEWVDKHPYRDAFFSRPRTLTPLLSEFEEHAADRIVQMACDGSDDEASVVAVLGISSIFGFLKVSDLVARVAGTIPGRLLVFFPGSVSGNVYRLMDARDGWNYLAVPITAFEDGGND